MIFPPQCKKGGTVLLTALSSPLTGGQSIADIAAGVEGLGFRVQVGETCQASTARGYAAAPPELRARELHNAFASPGIDAIWCVRGGSTAWQLLPLLDSGLIAANPKPFIGFSDVTTLHMALQQRCGLVSYHGPTANRVPDWGTDRFSWPGLLSALEMTGALPIENPPGEPIHVIRPGRAQGGTSWTLRGGFSIWRMWERQSTPWNGCWTSSGGPGCWERRQGWCSARSPAAAMPIGKTSARRSSCGSCSGTGLRRWYTISAPPTAPPW